MRKTQLMCSDPWKDDLLRTRQYMKDRPDYRRINHHKQNWDGHNRKLRVAIRLHLNSLF